MLVLPLQLNQFSQISAMAGRAAVLLLAATVAAILAIGVAQPANGASTAALTTLSKERLVLQTEHGDLHLAFYAKVRRKRESSAEHQDSWQ